MRFFGNADWSQGRGCGRGDDAVEDEMLGGEFADGQPFGVVPTGGFADAFCRDSRPGGGRRGEHGGGGGPAMRARQRFQMLRSAGRMRPGKRVLRQLVLPGSSTQEKAPGWEATELRVGAFPKAGLWRRFCMRPATRRRSRGVQLAVSEKRTRAAMPGGRRAAMQPTAARTRSVWAAIIRRMFLIWRISGGDGEVIGSS